MIKTANQNTINSKGNKNKINMIRNHKVQSYCLKLYQYTTKTYSNSLLRFCFNQKINAEKRSIIKHPLVSNCVIPIKQSTDETFIKLFMCIYSR